MLTMSSDKQYTLVAVTNHKAPEISPLLLQLVALSPFKALHIWMTVVTQSLLTCADNESSMCENMHMYVCNVHTHIHVQYVCVKASCNTHMQSSPRCQSYES